MKPRYRGEENRFGRQSNERKRSFSPKPNMNRGRFDDRRGERDNPHRYGNVDNRRDTREPPPPPPPQARGSFGGHERRPDVSKREFNPRDHDRDGRQERPRERNDHHEQQRNRSSNNKRSPTRSIDRNERPRSPPPMRANNPFRRNKNESEDRSQSDFRHDGQKADRNDDRAERNDRPERNERFEKNGSANRQRFKNRESDDENYEWGKPGNSAKKHKDDDDEKSLEKEKPNFGLSGKLTEDANKVNGVIIKYAEPPEARRPKRKWRLYPFKNDQSLNTIYIHRQSCFLIGRDKKVCE